MPKYQFYCDDDLWDEWKETVPRSKSLEHRLVELIKADRDGRVLDERQELSTEVKESTQDEQFSDLEFPAGIDRVEYIGAIDAAREYIQENGGATKAELVREVMPDYPTKYDADEAIDKIDSGKRYRGAWWRRVIKPGLKASDDIEEPEPGGSEWKPAT